jgi:ATP-dependent RNA helicase DeaD
MTTQNPSAPSNAAEATSPTRETFSTLVNNPIIRGKLAELNIVTPTPVQCGAIPVVLEGHDLIAQAQTGSGKTLAFVLPVLAKLLEAKDVHGTFALIVTPTRELAVQVRNVVTTVMPDVQPACIIGGAKQAGQVRELRNDPRIIVGTPGRLLDLIEQREIVLSNCKMFVLDEADEMLSMGFVEEVRAILSKLPRERQGLFFSATITPRVDMLAGSFLKNPKRVECEVSPETAPQIEHLFNRVDGQLTSKAIALAAFLREMNPKSAIVFCNTKSDTELVEIMLRKRGFQPERLNSDLTQKERDATMGRFRSGELKLLIATDVAARGIDIQDIELVVNYAIHEQAETYVHRTGRTGRAGRSGTALSLVGPQDFFAFNTLQKSLPVALKEVQQPAQSAVAATA